MANAASEASAERLVRAQHATCPLRLSALETVLGLTFFFSHFKGLCPTFDANDAKTTSAAASNLAVGSAKRSAAAVAASQLRATARRSMRGGGGAKPRAERSVSSSLRLLGSILLPWLCEVWEASAVRAAKYYD